MVLAGGGVAGIAWEPGVLHHPALAGDQILERRVRAAQAGGVPKAPPNGDLVAAVAAPTPTPGGGSVAAYAGALAAALAQMVAGLTAGRKKFAEVEAAMREAGTRAESLVTRLRGLVELDAQSYLAVSSAYKLPKDTPEQRAQRDAAITAALIGASEVPLETARACAAVAGLAELVATKGNPSAVSDAGVSALLAEAACRGAAYNVRINVASLGDPAKAHALVEAVGEFVRETSAACARATAEVERHI